MRSWNATSIVLPAEADFGAFLREHAKDDGLRHVVVTRGNRIVGVMRVNTELRHGLEGAYSGVHFGDIAQRNFTVARESDVMFDVVRAHVNAATPPWRW